MKLSAFVSFFTVVLYLQGAMAAPHGTGSLANQALAEKLRYGNVKMGGRLQQMTSAAIQQWIRNASSFAAILPDTPFIQLRSDPDTAAATGTKENPRILKLRQGRSAVLRCEVLGMPAPLAYWTKNGLLMLGEHNNGNGQTSLRQGGRVVEMLANSGRPTLEHAATVAKLKLACVKPSDAGLYECNGDNGVDKVVAYTRVIVESAEAVGASTSGGQPSNADECIPAEEPVSNIDSAPVIYMYTDMRLEYPGNDAQLMCRAEGQPRPSVRWYDSNETPIRNGRNFTLLSNGDLLVRSIDFGAHQPFRQFICQAFNSMGDDKAAVDLLAISRAK